MNNEKTLKGNPNKFTINQHIHTVQSISKFTNDNGSVDFCFKDSKKHFFVKPENQLFCGKRVWSEKSEKGFIKTIEDNFHSELNLILKNGIISNNMAISEYFLLWRIKYSLKEANTDDVKLNIISAENHSKEDEEYYEKNHLYFIQSDGSMPSRFLNDINVIQLFDMNHQYIDNLQWGIISSTTGEFIVADCYLNYMFFPISPKISLGVNYHNSKINHQELRRLNNLSINESQIYYFARNLHYCPY